MPSSDTIKAQQAATAAEVAAATAKLYAQSQQELADDAAASATEASGYAQNASDSASLAQQYYAMSIEGVLWFVGDFSAAPTTRSNGSALEPGDMYKNTTDNLVYSYNSDGTWSTMNSDATTIQDLYASGEDLLSQGQSLYEQASEQYDASVEMYEFSLSIESNLESAGINTIEVSNDQSLTNNRDELSIAYGSDGSRVISIDPDGILKTGARDENGVKTSGGVTMPFVSNTGNIIKTGIGTFAEKQLWLPSDGFEDSFASPSFGITYDETTGKPTVAIITPVQTLSGSPSWPDQTREGKTFWNFLLADDITGKYLPYPSSLGQNSSARYIQIARWKVSSTPWNTELKLSITSSNTGDNFLGTVTLEANIQSSGTSFATTSNLTQANLSKYIKVKFDGPRDRLPLASATSASVPAFGCTTDGTYLYLYAYIPAGQSSPKLTQAAIGTGSALTVDYTGTTTVTTAPSGFVFVPMWSDTNGLNTSVANDGSVVASDNHVRICSTSGSNTTRPDIAYDGFLWAGYGTYKNGRQSCSITHSSTGVYVVTGPHSSAGWQLRQPVDQNGEQVAIARVTSTSSDGLTNTISVYAIKYTYDSTAGTVTRGIGDLMDIPSTSWVDMHASTTF